MPIKYTRTKKTVEQPNNPLHGVKLADILSELVADIGWEQMAADIRSKIMDSMVNSMINTKIYNQSYNS